MQVKHKDLDEGVIALVPDNVDDFWSIRNIVEPGDHVRSLTYRSPEDAEDKIRPEGRKKQAVKLTIEVLDIEYQDFSNRLRIGGPIREGKEDYIGRHHTINVEQNKQLTIKKESWKKDQLERIESAVRESNKPKVVIIGVEEGEATVGVIRRHGVGDTTTINAGSGKNLDGETDKRKDFFSEINKVLKRTVRSKGIDSVVLAGPGFTKDDLYDYIVDKNPELEEKIIREDTSQGGVSGIHEAIKRGAVERIWKESRITEEANLVDSLLKKIAKDGKATYGFDSVSRAVELGAVEQLIITENTLRELREEGDGIEELLEKAEQQGGKNTVISSKFEPGDKLEALGGIGALLRFKIK
ncbi:mRNA surveillance protein pelota [Methanonatronarchaeum sp. AMET6-2]|uniref:mRNA surveillance protein pelota n=1 Tax=Methanonatronarchaeum sp. AMET6-2 TaxID=2933293 RepID=UPI001222FFC8|nr:mRNA surveillance protein pelota [Methanonatronarchaeum sp. AMET6-2]RZN62050.1 MAG: mRNA surveillance protein pelota [Methanonatronarchaeia archaeon]UOY10373.1 mRNA surveillance protein pelota [Methanonatronarchaeum sp. AMET6-2]